MKTIVTALLMLCFGITAHGSTKPLHISNINAIVAPSDTTVVLQAAAGAAHLNPVATIDDSGHTAVLFRQIIAWMLLMPMLAVLMAFIFQVVLFISSV